MLRLVVRRRPKRRWRLTAPGRCGPFAWTLWWAVGRRRDGAHARAPPVLVRPKRLRRRSVLRERGTERGGVLECQWGAHYCASEAKQSERSVSQRRDG